MSILLISIELTRFQPKNISIIVISKIISMIFFVFYENIIINLYGKSIQYYIFFIPYLKFTNN